MTTASAPATSSEHRDPLFQSTKHRIASLSSKNEEILDQINKLQHSHSQTLTVINSQLETNGSGQQIDSLFNNLKSRQRRSSNSQQQSISSILRSDKLSNGKDLENVMEVEDYEINETRTIAVDDSLSLRKSAKLAMANRKEFKKMDHLTPNNNAGGLDRKYFSAENNSDSENDDGNSSSMEDKDFDDNNSRRRIFKGHPTLTINTNAKSSRLITPESSDSEFDISNAHMPLAPTLGGGRNPLRAARHSSAEHYNTSTTDRRGRATNSLFSSVDEVIEEERGSLSDVAEQNEVGASENNVRMRGKQITSVNGRKRAQKYIDEYNVGTKMHRRPQTDDPYADIPDDNSSVMSTDSFIQLEELRARIQKLESERMDDEIMSERRSQRRKKNHSDSILSPAALSPDSSQGGASSTASFSRHSSAVSAQHQKHLQNAFDMFERAFTTTDHLTNDSSPPPSHSMAMVVSSALSLNQKLRSVMTQMELDGQSSERRLKSLLKTSDEQVRSLTECLLALAPLAPKRVATKKMSGERDPRGNVYYPSDPSLLQMPLTNSARSISPIPRISSAPVLYPHEPQIGEHVDQFPSRKVSPIPPPDQSSPPNSYYVPPRTSSRYSRLSRPTSPTLPPTLPENYNDSQNSTSRVLDYRERKSRRSSGAASYSGTNPASSSSPSPPPMQHPPTHYDQPGSRVYYEREIPREAPREALREISRELPRELPRLQRYNHTAPQQTTSAYQRTTTRPLSFSRTDELSYPLSHHVRSSSTSSSSIQRSSSGRPYAPRVASEDSPLSATRSQPPSRIYEYTRRYPSDGQSPIDRRPTPGLETDRRYSRRILNQYEPDDGYDGPNGYVENISERDYIRDDKAGIRRNISNSNSTYRQRMLSAQEQKVNGNVRIGNGEIRGEVNQQDEINHNGGQDVQVNGSNVENGEENDGYI